MMYYINELRFKIECFCIDHPILVPFFVGFILGALIL